MPTGRAWNAAAWCANRRRTRCCTISLRDCRKSYASGTTDLWRYYAPLITTWVTIASICLAARPPFSIGMAWTLCRSPSIIGRRLPMADKAPLLFSPRLGGLFPANAAAQKARSEEHTSELQSLMRISYAVFCLKQKKRKTNIALSCSQYELYHIHTINHNISV